MKDPKDNKRLRTYRKRNDLQERILSDNFKTMIDEFNKSIKIQTSKLGMTKKSLDKFLEGEEILMCNNCDTMNRYELLYDEQHSRSFYYCDGCKSISIVDYPKT